ncbi:hypothetical protein CBS115989_3592 [Aspergillus niger]|nr:hypothetical protein CBS115989_3592 [Aspergillus niger]KAI2853465.1 hypothetical protein CBS11350_203 [Aspergillus niger]KAI2861449.1 hypothetical protein CBS11232_1085 [Aspergillus niger]KAI2871700.1 hypothetical protein CBS115988_8381 [Aspergillus niger]KAI2919331.1 hypothetical protein CBS147371_3694 [Aspergillus niger]
MSRFLQPFDSDNGKDLIGEHAELKVLSIYHSSGLPWAKAAEKEAIVAAADSPSLMVIQALECLQHYWFAIGQPYRGNLCLALAYRACHLLGYTNNSNGIVGLDHDMSLESELARRCFWACWTSTCIVMEPEPYIKSSWQEVAMLPLPGEIRSTPSGYKIMPGETMDENWTSRALTPAANSGSVPANLMKMVGVCGNYCRLHCRENLRSIQHKIYINRRIFKILISQHPAVKAKIPRRPPQDTLKSWSPQVKIQAPLLVC